MGILNIAPDNFEVKLKDITKQWFIIISAESKDKDYQSIKRFQEYIQDRKGEIQRILGELNHLPTGPEIRKVIWDVLGVWCSVRKDSPCTYREGSNLTKYYKIGLPRNIDPSRTSEWRIWDTNWEIESRDGFMVNKVDISITLNSTAPYDGYKF